jgi:hypothetical protein
VKAQYFIAHCLGANSTNKGYYIRSRKKDELTQHIGHSYVFSTLAPPLGLPLRGSRLVAQQISDIIHCQKYTGNEFILGCEIYSYAENENDMH